MKITLDDSGKGTLTVDGVTFQPGQIRTLAIVLLRMFAQDSKRFLPDFCPKTIENNENIGNSIVPGS